MITSKDEFKLKYANSVGASLELESLSMGVLKYNSKKVAYESRFYVEIDVTDLPTLIISPDEELTDVLDIDGRTKIWLGDMLVLDTSLTSTVHLKDGTSVPLSLYSIEIKPHDRAERIQDSEVVDVYIHAEYAHGTSEALDLPMFEALNFDEVDSRNLVERVLGIIQKENSTRRADGLTPWNISLPPTSE